MTVSDKTKAELFDEIEALKARAEAAERENKERRRIAVERYHRICSLEAALRNARNMILEAQMGFLGNDTVKRVVEEADKSLAHHREGEQPGSNGEIERLLREGEPYYDPQDDADEAQVIHEAAPVSREAWESLGTQPDTGEDEALDVLDRTQYRQWRHTDHTHGYVCGDVPIARLVQIVEAYRARQRVPDEWQQPEWRPIDTYPKEQGIYRDGSRVWLWHEDLGVCWGYMDDLPSGFRCEVFQLHHGTWVVRDSGIKAAKKLHYWMPRAPTMPEPPRCAIARSEGEKR
jgi:hypothetical protein